MIERKVNLMQGNADVDRYVYNGLLNLLKEIRKSKKREKDETLKIRIREFEYTWLLYAYDNSCVMWW